MMLTQVVIETVMAVAVAVEVVVAMGEVRILFFLLSSPLRSIGTITNPPHTTIKKIPVHDYNLLCFTNTVRLQIARRQLALRQKQGTLRGEPGLSLYYW